MNFDQEHDLPSFISNIQHLEDATSALSTYQKEQIAQGRHISIIATAADPQLQQLHERIDRVVTELNEHIAGMNNQAPSNEIIPHLNHTFRVLRQAEGLLRQYDTSQHELLNSLVNKITHLQERILSAPTSSEHFQEVTTVRRARTEIDLIEEYVPENTSQPLKLLQPDQTRLALAQRDDYLIPLRQLCSQFPATVFDPAHASSLLEEIVMWGASIEEQSSLYTMLCPTLIPSLEALTSIIDKQAPHQATRMRHALTELLTLTCAQPYFDNQPISSISPERLVRITQQLRADPSLFEVLIQPPLGVALSHETTVLQKLLYVSHLNFSVQHIRHVRSDRLVQTLLRNPNLKMFLIENNIHVNQCYKESCIGTSHNLLIQARCGSIAELLYVTRETIKILRRTIMETRLESTLTKAAYQTITGSPPSTREHIAKIIESVQNDLQKITDSAVDLMTQQEVKNRDIHILTKKWNETMQLLETVLKPECIVIPSTLVLPTNYMLSSFLSSIATAIGQFAPGQPRSKARQKNEMDTPAIANINCELFSCSEILLLGTPEMQHDLGPFVVEKEQEGKITIQAIWNEVFITGGASLRISGAPEGKQCGHATALFAAILKGHPVFLLRDPMGIQQYYTLAEMMTFLQNHRYLFMILQPLRNL